MTREKRKRSFLEAGPRRTLVMILGGIVASFVTLDKVVMPWYVDHGVTHQVPSVLGLDMDHAIEILQSAGLEAVQSETKPDPKARMGTVTAQNPPPDASVKQGRRVYLTVSGGEVLVQVPKLRGLSVRDARFALERAGLYLGVVNYAASETLFENTIIEQSFSSGEKIPKGSAVGVIVSSGMASKELRVPDLTGKTVAEAEKILAKEGLKVGRITYETGLNLIPNTIVDQFPRPQEQVSGGTVIDLFVARLDRGKEEVPGREN